GAELCRQIMSLRPAALVMYERHENGLYMIEKELHDRGLRSGLSAVIGDVTDRGRLDDTLARYEIEIVFHAAAHKHVPMMEENLGEAVKNNVRGTRVLIEAAAHGGVSTFILVSTANPVNPTNLLETSKR